MRAEVRLTEQEQAVADRWGPGKDYGSAGPIKTVTELVRRARRVQKLSRYPMEDATAAYFLRNIDAVMARPEHQKQLIDIHRRVEARR